MISVQRKLHGACRDKGHSNCLTSDLQQADKRLTSIVPHCELCNHLLPVPARGCWSSLHTPRTPYKPQTKKCQSCYLQHTFTCQKCHRALKHHGSWCDTPEGQGFHAGSLNHALLCEPLLAAPCTKPHSETPSCHTRVKKTQTKPKLLVLLEGRSQSSSLTAEDSLEPFRLKDGLSTNCSAPVLLYLPMSSYTEVKTTQTVTTQRISTALGKRRITTEFLLQRHCFPDTHQHPHPLAALIHQRV